MSDQSEAKPEGSEPRGGALKWALWGAALIGVAAVVYIIAQSSIKPPAADGTGKSPAVAQNGVSGGAAKNAAEIASHANAGTPPPDYAFDGPKGTPVKLADFKGRVVVMNVWATWCGPCKEEMPTLAKLQAAYAGKPVEVVAITIDTPSDTDKAKAFLAQHPPLAFYQDGKSKLPFVLKPAAEGTPVTIIYGKDGLERTRVNGANDWSKPEVRAEIDRLLAEG